MIVSGGRVAVVCAVVAGMLAGGAEPFRVSRRLHFMRGWSHDKAKQVFAGSTSAGSADGAGPREGVQPSVGPRSARSRGRLAVRRRLFGTGSGRPSGTEGFVPV